MSDVGNFPFIQAAHCRAGRQKQPRLVVIHDMEAPESATTALSVARYFARPDSRVASAHFCIDSAETIRCVHDSDTAYGAASANADGLHIEHAGYERQTPAEWVDDFGRAMLNRSAQVAALWSRRYNIPPVHLNIADLKAGKPGFVGHADVSKAWPSTGHSDPGAGFPWTFYLDLVKHYLTPQAAPVTAQAATPPTPVNEDNDMMIIHSPSHSYVLFPAWKKIDPKHLPLYKGKLGVPVTELSDAEFMQVAADLGVKTP